MSTVFDVKNIHCQNCSKRIVAAVQSVHPQSQVKIEVETGRVTVQPAVQDIPGVISAIAEAGYEASTAA